MSLEDVLTQSLQFMLVKACRCILGKWSKILLTLFKLEKKKIAKVLEWEIKFLDRSYGTFKINSATEYIRKLATEIITKMLSTQEQS